VNSLAYMVLRVTGFWAAFPPLFGPLAPRLMKGALGFVFVIFLAFSNPLPVVEFGARAALAELVLGLGMGFVLRLVFWAFRSAGEAVGFTTSAMATFNVGNEGQVNLWGHAYDMAAQLLFFAVGGPAAALQALAATLKEAPLGSLTLTALPMDTLLPLIAKMSIYTLLLCMPPLAAGLLVQWGLGIVLRVAPQFQLFSFSLPAGAMAALWTLSLFLPAWPTLFNAAFSDSLRAASSLAGAMHP
jgi:flagellar biosynthetic protein FliR